MKRTNNGTNGLIRTKKAVETKPSPAIGTPREFDNIDRWWEKRASYVSSNVPKRTKPVEPFASPEDMWLAACEYFEWMESRPLYEARPFHYQGHVNIKNIPKRRPYTIGGLLLFFDISIYVYTQYRRDRGPEFAAMTDKIDSIIFTQKFEGAAADLFNASIIARDLGLKEHSEITGANDGPIINRTEHVGNIKVDLTGLTDMELDSILKVIEASKQEEEIGKDK